MDKKTISGGSVYKVDVEKCRDYDVLISQYEHEIVVKGEDLKELIETLKGFLD